MLEEEKLIPKSRIAPAAGTSREFTEKVIRQLEDEGQIETKRTPGGRGLLSFAEVRVVWERMGLS